MMIEVTIQKEYDLGYTNGHLYTFPHMANANSKKIEQGSHQGL